MDEPLIEQAGRLYRQAKLLDLAIPEEQEEMRNAIATLKTMATNMESDSSERERCNEMEDHLDDLLLEYK